MKHYEDYKESNIQWIGEIPKHWSTTKLKFISNIYNGNSLNDDLKEKFESDNLNYIPYISTKDVEQDTGKINFENGIRIPKDEGNFRIAPKGSFVLCIEGGSAGKKIGYINEDTYFVNKLACFDYSNKFLFYFVLGTNFKNQFFNSLSGLIGGVSISTIRNFFTTFPSLEEQAQIAAFLDYKTNLIDATIEKKKRLIELLKEKRQAVINEAVTKGLNPNAPIKDSGVEWLGEIPEHWEVKKIKHLAKIRNGKDQKEVLIEEGGYPILGTGGEFGRASSFLYDKPSVLLGRKGTIDKPFYIEEPFWTVDTLFYTEVYENTIPKYLYYVCTTIRFDYYQESSAVPSMTQDNLNNISLCYPSKEEQISIVNHIEKCISRIDLLNEKLKSQIDNLQTYRKSLISEAVTGKIDVRDWQVN